MDFPLGSTGRVHGYGHYHDTYVKLEAGWRIAFDQAGTPPGGRHGCRDRNHRRQ